MVNKPTRAFSLSEFDTYIESLLRDRAVDVGRACIQWNALHERFGIFFASLFERQGLARKVWHSSNSDRAQRRMLEAAADYDLSDKPNLKEGIIWAIHQADAWEDERNNIVHSPYAPLLDDDGEFRVIPAHHSGNKRANRLKGRDLQKDARAFVTNIGALGTYVRALTTCLTYKKEALPLPQKPQLLRPAHGSVKKAAHPGDSAK